MERRIVQNEAKTRPLSEWELRQIEAEDRPNPYIVGLGYAFLFTLLLVLIIGALAIWWR